ncbi:MAG TPA: sigma factor-like helix-turn-helix DNA-binding protein [Candidatus Paceibacterota bacterium]
MSKTETIKFKPKQVTKRLISVLSERGRDVITKRYGLEGEDKKMTLDAIGKKYGITRERVRQIENHSLSNIRKSKDYEKEKGAFDQLKQYVESLGAVISEEDLLGHISKDKSVQNHVHFMLVIGEEFTKEKEDEEFKHRWYVDKNLAEKIHNALRKLYGSMADDELVIEGDMINAFLNYVEDVSDKYRNDEIAKRWLRLSKKIKKNPLGEWGKASSPNVSAKGMRDYAFLVIRKHGSPIHFREVAKAITTYFNKKAHVATTHNELIKDPRFVLVGRGLYALAEWGYMSGVVKDVIKKVLEKNGPLTREKIVEKVLKERYVKENTILVNLQNPKFFYKDKEGKYHNVGDKS